MNGNVIKERAAQLRAAGDAQVERHPAEQIGKTHRILMENPHMGRTEQFTEVAFSAAHGEGSIVTAVITTTLITTMLSIVMVAAAFIRRVVLVIVRILLLALSFGAVVNIFVEDIVGSATTPF